MTDQGEVLVNLSQVEHLVVVELDNRLSLRIVNRRVAIFHAVDTRYIDNDIYHVAAKFVDLHIDRRAVSGDIDFRKNVDQEGFLHTTVGDQDVEQILERRQLRYELLYHLREGLEDGVVVDRRETEVQVDSC